jgi:hypothetical protein
MTLADAELAVVAAQSGAAVVRQMYGGPLARSGKRGGNFATTADVASEKAILDFTALAYRYGGGARIRHQDDLAHPALMSPCAIGAPDRVRPLPGRGRPVLGRGVGGAPSPA